MTDRVITCVLAGSWPKPATNWEGPGLAPATKVDGESYVIALRDACARHAPGVPFVCFSDRPRIGDVDVRVLPPGLPMWWGKIYNFAGHFPYGTRLLAFDLDTVIVRSLEPLLAVPLDLPVFIKGTWKHPCAHRSGVFSYQLTPETDAIWNEFVNPAQTRLGAPFTHPRIGKHVGIWNDEQWFGVYVGKNAWRGWHEVLAPGVLLGFKTDMHMSTQPLERETHVVYFDGLPRPHDVVAPWNYLTAPEHLRGEIPAEASLPVTGKWRIL